MDNRRLFLEKAEALKPRLQVETVRPVSGLPDAALSEGDSVVLDFGNHFVGRLTLCLSFEGSHPDAPAWLRLKFAERLQELRENVENYRGWISASWVPGAAIPTPRPGFASSSARMPGSWRRRWRAIGAGSARAGYRRKRRMWTCFPHNWHFRGAMPFGMSGLTCWRYRQSTD